MLEADKLQSDPRIAQAKKLLLETVRDHQQHINEVRPPDPALKPSYDALLASYASSRGGKLWFPYLGSGLGNGALVELLDGSVKYDFICGIGPHFFGHSHLALIASGIDAALSDTVMQGNLQQNGDSVALCESLVKASGLHHCFLTTSGAMATENALKIAFQKKFPAHRILAFEHCFVGRTLTLSQITDKATFREGLPSQILVDYLPYFDAARPEESTRNAVEVLKNLLIRYPKDYAVMIFEMVQGEGGFNPGQTDFFLAIIEILKNHGILIFDDEVQTFGRLPELFSFHYFGLQKWVDIVTIGKLSQVCATLFTPEVCPRPGLLSQTFTASTSAIRAAQVILDDLQQGDYYGPQGKIVKFYNYFEKKLTAISHRHPHLIKGPFGLGSMIAFTFYDGDQQQATKFAHALFEAGVMTFIAGLNPTRIRMLLPVGVITLEDIDRACEIIEATLVKCS